MNTIEDRLRAAVQAAAGTVAPGSAPPLNLPGQPGRRLGRARRPRRGGWPRWVTPLAAAASVIAVIAASLAITGGGSTHARARPRAARTPARARPRRKPARSGPPRWPAFRRTTSP